MPLVGPNGVPHGTKHLPPGLRPELRLIHSDPVNGNDGVSVYRLEGCQQRRPPPGRVFRALLVDVPRAFRMEAKHPSGGVRELELPRAEILLGVRPTRVDTSVP